MKSLKITLSSILGLLFLFAIIAGGELALDELSLLLLAIIATGSLRVFYKELHQYFTHYESPESSHHYTNELKKSTAEPSKSELV